ncbi:recombinase family protein [Micropruina sp.]|uniref:recombinase family protein n=1 Tax=Micropruina sp. TaxID=2737536 RepID=UPI0039E5D73F
MSPKRVRTCALYVRISLRTEESVSIERQVEAGTKYAEARGWKVVGVFRDEGVSATHNRPEDRDGWRALLASPSRFDAVVVWKVDRLARRVMDFLNANEAVKERGAGLVAVEDPIDMTTAQGEAFAIMLAVFGQMEAAAMRDRQRAARAHLLKHGRYPGGTVLYGYRSVPNPQGPGYVLVHDEEEIKWVREIVRRTMAGQSLYSTMQWLRENNAPVPARPWLQKKLDEAIKKADANPADRALRDAVEAARAKRDADADREWRYLTVDRLVRHPLLAGMIPHNPSVHSSGTRSKVRGDEVVRDEDGLPVIDETLAVMPVGQWRAMQAKLAEPTPQRQPRALKRKHSGLLSGLMWCGEHDEPVRMWRKALGTKGNLRLAYNCRSCGQNITTPDAVVVSEFLARLGDVPHLQMLEEVVEGGSVQLQEASVRLTELGREVVNASPDRAAEIIAEMTRLKAVQEEARHQPATRQWVPVGADRTYAEDWAAAETDEDRRLVLGDALNRVLVRRGPIGQKGPAARLARMTFEWLPHGQITAPSDAELASWAGA